MHEERGKIGIFDQIVAFVWETLKIVLISLAIIIPIRYYLVQPFFVKGQSMEPNFEDKDYILVDKISYRLNSPERGDVIVFKYPEDPREYFIKRIVGLPGETVDVKDNKVTVYNNRYPDGLVLRESMYLPASQSTLGTVRTRLGDDEYFVLGDNRLHSSDSRRWGALDKSLISGKAWIRLWPLNSIGSLPGVAYPTPKE